LEQQYVRHADVCFVQRGSTGRGSRKGGRRTKDVGGGDEVVAAAVWAVDIEKHGHCCGLADVFCKGAVGRYEDAGTATDESRLDVRRR
jgi:hypothetical protein